MGSSVPFKSLKHHATEINERKYVCGHVSTSMYTRIYVPVCIDTHTCTDNYIYLSSELLHGFSELIILTAVRTSSVNALW